MSKKNKEKKDKEFYTVHKVFKNLHECSAVTLRKKLIVKYPDVWANSSNLARSDEKRIRGILDKLVAFGLAAKSGKKEKTYTYIHDNNILDKIHKIAHDQNVNFDKMKSYYKRRNSIISLLNDVSENYYIQTQMEDIGTKEKLIKDLELAIEKRNNVTINFKENSYTVSPLKIALFDGYWYLVAYNTKYYTYRIKDISHVKITDEIYQEDIEKPINLKEWHNSWHDPLVEQKKILLHIDKTAFPFFKEKNILGVNNHADRLIPCNDGWEYECLITHPWELLPTLMQWQKHVTVLTEEDGAGFIKTYRNILNGVLERLPCPLENL